MTRCRSLQVADLGILGVALSIAVTALSCGPGAIIALSTAGGGGGGGGGGGAAPAAPAFATDLPEDAMVAVGDVLTFTVRAVDDNGDLERLTLLNPPAGACVLDASRRSSSTSDRILEVRWVVVSTAGGAHRFVFRARDEAGHSAFLEIDVRILGFSNNVGILHSDVTGDGVLDTIAGTALADEGGLDRGGIYVWAGREQPAGDPTARLTVSGAANNDRLGTVFSGQGIHCCDVTGDGILDIVAGAVLADVGLVLDAGAVYVWKGGDGLEGNKQPTATLTAPSPVASDLLASSNGQGLQCCDVTGDGIADVLAGAQNRDGAVVNAGAVFLWHGGPDLEGAETADAVLAVPGAVANDFLGSASGQGYLCCDVSGDGTLDVIAGTPSADAGFSNNGAVYYWRGGSGLSGTPAPAATLTVPGVANDTLTSVSGLGIQCCDVTDDNIQDLIVGAFVADTPAGLDTGAVYVWRGGSSLSGNVGPTAILVANNAAASDFLGSAAGRAIQCCDVSGDGVADVIAAASSADLAAANVGAIYVWRGTSNLSGTVAPSARLAVTGALLNDNLGSTSGQAFQCCDVSGDDVLDIVAGAFVADRPGVLDAGAVYMWRGGSSLSGNIAQTATLTVNGAASDFLSFGSGLGVQCCDVTGDDLADVVVSAIVAEGAVADAGAIYVWRGGGNLAGSVQPNATLTNPQATAFDNLGNLFPLGVQCCDVTGDGIRDIVTGTSSADVGGLNTGAIYLWEGNDNLAGDLDPSATLSVNGAVMNDSLGSVSGLGILCVDVTGDGIVDIVAGASSADRGGILDTGAIYLWRGRNGFAGNVQPDKILVVNGAVAGDLLGIAAGQGIHCADITGDGTPDIIAGASLADDGASLNEGKIYVWKGGSFEGGQVLDRTATYSVPNAVAGDQLGQL